MTHLRKQTVSQVRDREVVKSSTTTDRPKQVYQYRTGKDANGKVIIVSKQRVL